MSHGVYRSRDGRERIAAWSRERLSGWGLPHEVDIVPTSSGNTFALTAGSGPTVLLLPGTNFSATTWLEVVTVLSEAYRVVALDLPGQPGLSAPERPRCAAAYGDWLGDVINQLDLREVVVVAVSLCCARLDNELDDRGQQLGRLVRAGQCRRAAHQKTSGAGLISLWG